MMQDESFELGQINKFLKPFGSIPNEPKSSRFRVVWSDFQREMRQGEFNVYCGPVFIRTEVGVRETEKYPYISSRYVLEQWYPPEIAYNREIPNSRYGSYEPIYVFEDKDGNRLPLWLKIVEIIMHSKFNDSESEAAKKSRQQAKEDMKNVEELKYFEEALDCSDMASNLHFGEGIIVPKEYDIESVNLRKKKENVTA